MSVQNYKHNGEKPLNREPPLEKLISNFITTEDGYDRNHGPIPIIDAKVHRVTVDGAVRTRLSLSLQDLKSLPQYTVICALQCAGNRRHTMRTEIKEVSGIDWFDGAVMNCKWRGPLLREVLMQAGGTEIEEADAHVAFACHQNPCEDDEWYGASIPLARAMSKDADVLVALEMNDAPLTPKHGYPVRVITPGIAGARSVKWLDRITVQRSESPNYYQQRDYKILPPNIDSPEKADRDDAWDHVPAIQDMPVNSVIGVPTANTKVERDAAGAIDVKGYALPAGSSGPVTKVEVSGDGGRTWQDAELLGDEHHEENGTSLKWAWRLWRTTIKMEEGKGRTLLSRATDKGGNMQEKRSPWNLRGCAYNGYGEVRGLEIV
ncbi:sulfite oxidase [Lasiodiplodia theobromae]|uniref:Sulfite oxidase n=1 Tax=Lasiodiplodia theobromae TaxID=45133 RepID=UPI0015C316E4|nr:Sulfite oxidase [Lasiodiplodia theobromae]KAF4534062.1 Sulfite oxidase [Lasiodiplodia theobromae]KAF9633091.1 sulfite oxidase [Lasiodiplodia theobromae]